MGKDKGGLSGIYEGSVLQNTVNTVRDAPSDLADWTGRQIRDGAGAARDFVTDTAEDIADSAMDTAGDALTSGFMKKYGIAGGLTFLFCTIFRGMSWKNAGLAAGVVATLVGSLGIPMLAKAFNGASGANDPRVNPEITPDRLAATHGSNMLHQGSVAVATDLRVGGPQEPSNG